MTTPIGYRKFLLAFDTETSGLFFGDNPAMNETTGAHYQIVSIGAAVVDSDTLEVVDTLYVLVKWNGQSIWSVKAENVHGLSKQYLDQHGVSEEDALCSLLEFTMKYFGTSAISLIGHNVATFDLKFLQNMCKRHDVNVAFANKHIDTNSIGYAVFQTHNSNDLFELCGVKRDPNNHNALDDALACVKVLKQVRKLMSVVFAG